MTTLTRWMPLTELPIERRMRRMLDDIGFGPFMVPAADFYETGEDFVIELEAPGFDEQELGIEVSDHTLTIEGTRKTETTEDPEKTFRFHERLEKTFERQFLPSAGGRHGARDGEVRQGCARGPYSEDARSEAPEGPDRHVIRGMRRRPSAAAAPLCGKPAARSARAPMPHPGFGATVKTSNTGGPR
jgi:HSP20 family molecular chaperone IbpA